MAALSGAAFRQAAREAMLSCGLRGFVRLAPTGAPALLVADALRRSDASQQTAFMQALAEAGLSCAVQDGLAFLTPTWERLAALLHEAQTGLASVPTFRVEDPLYPAYSLGQRLLRQPEGLPWTEAGYALVIEALRLPEPSMNGWPEAERLRGPAAALMRQGARGGLCAAGVVLLSRLCGTQTKTMAKNII